jgi:hypothetical protein
MGASKSRSANIAGLKFQADGMVESLIQGADGSSRLSYFAKDHILNRKAYLPYSVRKWASSSKMTTFVTAGWPKRFGSVTTSLITRFTPAWLSNLAITRKICFFYYLQQDKKCVVRFLGSPQESGWRRLPTAKCEIGRYYFLTAMAIRLRPSQGNSLSMRLTKGIIVSKTFS